MSAVASPTTQKFILELIRKNNVIYSLSHGQNLT